jgi:Flp pilus assembly protein CpaB
MAQDGTASRTGTIAGEPMILDKLTEPSKGELVVLLLDDENKVMGIPQGPPRTG